MVSGFEMRVGDADRDAAAAALREHFVSGRLTQDELNERLDQAFAARTRGDLHAVMTDLPSAAPAGEPFGGPGSRWTQARAGYGQPGYGQRQGAGPGRWGGDGHGGPRGARSPAGSLVSSFVLLWALLALGSLAIFGAGQPLGFVLLFAAFALLKRIIIGIFRRRRGGRRGPRRRH